MSFNPDKVHITQSLMKELLDYAEGKQCGLQVEAKYVTKKYDFPSSAVQKIGQWFEYKATGSLPKNGLVPIEDRTKTGELTAPYKMINAQLNNWNKVYNQYKIKMLTKGRTISVTDTSIVPNPLTGTTDLEIDLVYDNKLYEDAIGDIKTSGLLYDNRNDLGWGTDSLSFKHKLVTQPVHYKLIKLIELQQKGNKDAKEPDFFFFLFSNTNETDHRIIHFNIDAEIHFAQHIVFLQKTHQELVNRSKYGWKPYPSIGACIKCPLALAGCKHKIDVAPVEEFYYDTSQNKEQF